MELTQEYTSDISHRFKYLTWIMIALFLVVAGRLYYLQIIKGPYYHFFSEQNSIKDIEIPALRGVIYDRNGMVVVDNRPTFDVTVIPQYVQDREKVIRSLSSILFLKEEDINTILAKAKNMPSYFPATIKSDVSDTEVATIRANKTPWYDESEAFDLRGVEVHMRYARTYPDGLAFSHLLGYLKEIDANRLKAMAEKGDNKYKMGDFVGIGGVEEMWDAIIRGQDGYDQRVVNASGREVIWPDIELIHEEPVNGNSLKLTIDLSLQTLAKEELADKSGAVVAIDPNNGKILALYSSPSIDLNKLSSPLANSYWQEIANDKEQPIFNRAIQGTYPPASTFKIVTALAALNEKTITPKDILHCGGGLTFGGRLYQCWNHNGHGTLDIIRAITASCDTFFYQLGLKLGVDKIAKYANLLGLGNITNIDLPREKSGLIPSTQWKLSTKGQPWQAGENLSIAVGQGYDTVSPLQNALMIATIANGGKKIIPHVTDEIIDNNGNVTYKWRDKEAEQVMDPEMLKIVKEGLKNVVQSSEGTAYRLNYLGLKIAGKTGTAQVIAREAWRAGVEELKDHAWFVGYAPYDDPKIAVAVLVEHGGFGAQAAAPIVGKIIQRYLTQ